MTAIGHVAAATAGDLDLGQEPPFLDDDDVEAGRQGLGPYGGVNPRRAAAPHDQRLLLLVPLDTSASHGVRRWGWAAAVRLIYLLLVGVVARGCADEGGG